MSGGRRRQTITRPGFFADPVWDASPSLSAEDDLDQTSSSILSEAQSNPGMEEDEEEGDSGDFHINATLSSLKEAVKNGLLNGALKEKDEDEDDANIETSDDDNDEALAIAYNSSDVFDARKMFRKAWENLIATSTSPMDRKLVGNLSLV